MADRDSKRYYWLKLEKDFFKRHDIRIIEGMPNGKDYIIFYLKLLCESTSHEGYLRFSETIPYNEDMLSTITNTNIDIVRSAIKIFTELQMMQLLDDGTFYFKQVEKMIGSETGGAERKRIYRETIKKQIGTNGGQCLLDIDKDIEIDKELDIEKDINIDIDSDKSLSNSACACEEEQINNLKELIQMIETTFNRNLTNAEYITLQEFKEKGMTNESIIRDLKTYSDKTNPIAYMKKMIENATLHYKPNPPQEEERDEEHYRYVNGRKLVRKSKWLDNFMKNGKDEED